MGISNKSHSKKSDKETQSPVLKLFRDMIQKEKHDPEKTNLLKSKGEKKKKKHSGSRSKSNKSIGSTCCTDRQDAPYKGNQSLLNAEIDPIRTQSNPFQGEKRESWWFWGDTADKPVSDETCSCVSCALKKLINTDYACIACLILLFTVSVLVAFLLVYKSIPCMSEKLGSGKAETDRPKRRIDGLSGLRWDELDKDSGGQSWNSGRSSFGVPKSMDVPDIQDLGSLISHSNSDVVKMLDKELMSEIQNSDKLRDFYKKLIKTDEQIQNLKKNTEINGNNIENFYKYGIYPERAKRSLKIFNRPLKLFHFKRNKHIRGSKLHENDKTNNNNKNTEEKDKTIAATKESNQKNTKSARNKRFDNTSEPEGFLIENKKVMVRYKPGRKSKCSHTPKESKSHETQLKHPFYQNTQRLDELLDRFLGKNLPELLDPFGLDLVFEKEKKCKHPKLKVDVEVTTLNNKVIKNEATTTFNKKFTEFDKFKKDKENTKMFNAETNSAHDLFAEFELSDGIKRETTTNTYGLIMSVSTMMFPDKSIDPQRTTYPPLIDRVPNARKLLQTDADDDMNEVIVDARSVDDNDDPEDRKKRMGESQMSLPSDKLKNNPASIINPNWKGPMPLYPDELSSMMKQGTPMNKVENPLHSKYNSEPYEEPVVNSVRKYADVNENIVETPLNKDTLAETDEFDANLNDMDYIEDYFRNKYDRLVEMAQAYSDYGVLEGKKSTDKVDEKGKSEVSDRRIKLSLSGLKKGFKNSIFGRSKKGNQESPSDNQNAQSEGFRLEFKPTSTSREDNPTELYRTLQKHLKISKESTNQYDSQANGVQDFDLMYTPKNVASKPTKKCERGVIFSLRKGKRSLKSVDIEEPESDKSLAINNLNVKKIYDEFENNTIKDADKTARNVIENVHRRLKREINSNVLTKAVTMDKVKSKLDSETETNKHASLSNFDEEISHGYNDTDVLKHTVSNNSLPTDIEFVKNKDEIENKLNLTDESNYKSDNMSLSNFFMLLSNWFSALDGVEINSNQSRNENLSDLNKSKELTNNSEISYPVYDSDMIENIGHRSRVLLSVDDVNATAKQGDKIVDSLADKTINITKNILKTANTENKTKSIVKRNVDDSNLIFWNDLYDDEYGVVDNFDNVREKYSAKNDFIKKPNDWFRDKVRKMADGFHKKVENFNRDHIDLKGKDKTTKDGQVKHKEAISNRFSRNVGGVPKADFTALTANMRKICRKAAKDVAVANKVDARDVSKEGQVTSTLMQQLVRLMGDLVDYQVKQRTCRKLPEDLQNFLEWLTAPDVTDTESDKFIPGYKTDEFSQMDFDKINAKADEHALDTAPEREEKPITRSDCLGTLQSVQALMKQYEDMSDDDKSKMTGVKEYLEHQMQFLQKQIASNGNDMYNIDPIRFRRDISKTLKDEKPKKKRRKLKHFFSNMIKKLGFKHRYNNNDKSTVINDNNAINNDKDANKIIYSKEKENVEKENESKTVKEKRNLRDVYYKAIGDAKKITTVKSN